MNLWHEPLAFSWLNAVHMGSVLDLSGFVLALCIKGHCRIHVMPIRLQTEEEGEGKAYFPGTLVHFY